MATQAQRKAAFASSIARLTRKMNLLSASLEIRFGIWYTGHTKDIQVNAALQTVRQRKGIESL